MTLREEGVSALLLRGNGGSHGGGGGGRLSYGTLAREVSLKGYGNTHMARFHLTTHMVMLQKCQAIDDLFVGSSQILGPQCKS